MIEVFGLFSFQEINVKAMCFFYLGYVCSSVFGFIYVNSAWNPKLSLLLAPQNNHSFVLSSSWGLCLAQRHIDGLVLRQKEQHLFCISPDEKFKLATPWLPVCISHLQATPSTLNLNCMPAARQENSLWILFICNWI